MTRSLAAALLSFLFVSCAGAADSGFYIGGGYGEATVEDHSDRPGGGTVNFDAGGRSYRGFIGYRARASQFIDLAGEATYVDYGRASQTSQGVSFQNHVRGGELAGLVILPFGLFDIYGKAGAVRWSSSTNIDGTATGRSGTSATYGFGAAFKVDKLALRAGYDRYDVSAVDNLQTFTLSVVFSLY